MTIEQLENNLDGVFRQYIKKRDKVCPITGAQRKLSVSHLFGQKDFPHIRWDETNAILMSNEIHDLYHRGNPFVYIDYFVDKYGAEALEDLKKRAYGRKKMLNAPELIALTTLYQKKTQQLPRRKK